LWSSDGSKLTAWKAHEGQVSSLYCSHPSLDFPGGLIYSGGNDGVVHVWNVIPIELVSYFIICSVILLQADLSDSLAFKYKRKNFTTACKLVRSSQIRDNKIRLRSLCSFNTFVSFGSWHIHCYADRVRYIVVQVTITYGHCHQLNSNKMSTE
jgi:WD40 repeat protein